MARLGVLFFCVGTCFLFPGVGEGVSKFQRDFVVESMIWNLAHDASVKAAVLHNKVTNAERELEKAMRIRDRYRKANAAIRAVDVKESELLVKEAEYHIKEAQAAHEAAVHEAEIWKIGDQMPRDDLTRKKQIAHSYVQMWISRLAHDEAMLARAKLRAQFESERYENLKKLEEKAAVSGRLVLESEFRHLDAEDDIHFANDQKKLTLEALEAAREREKKLSENSSSRSS